MKPTAQRRRDRRDLLDNLLSRALRGRLTTAEAALLAEQVREEQRAYDQTRRSLGETGTAYSKHREAADDAIRELEHRAKTAEATLNEQRQALATALHARGDHEWPALIDWAAQAHDWATRAAVKADRKRVEELEHERAVIAAELHAARSSADRFEAAWQSARQRATEQRTLAEARQRRLNIRRARIRELEHALASMADNRTGWMQRAQAESRAADVLAQERHRYRLAWIACRRDRKADRAAMAADLPAVQAVDRIREYIDAAYEGDVCEGVRRDVRRLCAGEEPTYNPPTEAPLIAVGPARGSAVITDRATIRNTLDEAEPKPSAPCPADCPCRAVCIAIRP
ncbi:hypothetical protein ACIQ6R_18045 [Streptomyces sp. NPDC096048]|uniref:hypothetical protein n=1 Tax=Streptomyces sp. NPDC096048 TaxID=3366072 RepID=UPI0038199747